MYSKYFGFEEFPFSVNPDPRFFYSNAAYQDVLAGLEHGIEARNGFTVVTGEAGTGKTTLLHRLVSSSAGTIEYALIINPRLGFIPLLRTILQNLGLPSSSTDRETLLEQLNGHLREQFAKGRTVALLFDEAQSLSDEVLEELRLLCNQEIGGATLTSIVLMGQPELENRLDNSRLHQIKQRITSRRRLTSLQDPDVRHYVASRLEHVGYKGDELFEPAAIERIISWSSGIPRLINTICDNALLLAYQASERRVTAGMIDEVAHHLRLVERPARGHQKNIDEVANRLRLVEHFQRANQKKIDEAGDQPRFVDWPPVEEPRNIDEVANRLRLVEHSQRASQEKIDEAGDQLRFVDRSPIAEKIEEVADQPRFVDRSPIGDQEKIDAVGDQARFVNRSPIAEKIDAVADQPRFVGRSPIEDQERIDEIANQPRFDDRPPVEDQRKIEEVADQLGLDDRLPIEDQRKIDEAVDQLRFVDHSPVADQGRVDEVANQLRLVDDRSAGSDQKPMPEIEQPQKVDITFRQGSVEAGSIVDDNAREASDQLIPRIYQAMTVSWRNYQLSKVNRLRISIGALMILVVVAGGLAVFYPRQREAAVPGNRYAENLSRGANKTAVPAVPVDNVKNNGDVNTKKMVEEPPQPVLATPPPSSRALENRDQNRDTPKKQKIVEAGNSGKTTDPASQEIYRVSGASFLRKRPAADAEIIDTLKPGIRIVVTNRSGEYLRVRSLSDERVSGFVHKEDAFFERIR
jgi:type II secretory pathway predicted ATPase ExeA